MPKLNLTLGAVQAIMYLHSDHLTRWEPACQDQVLSLSRKKRIYARYADPWGLCKGLFYGRGA